MKFRLLNIHDIEGICRQFSDPDMCEFFSEPPCDMEEAKGIIDHYQNPEGEGYLRYGMFDKETDSFIGTCGYIIGTTNLSKLKSGMIFGKSIGDKGICQKNCQY